MAWLFLQVERVKFYSHWIVVRCVGFDLTVAELHSMQCYNGIFTSANVVWCTSFS